MIKLAVLNCIYSFHLKVPYLLLIFVFSVCWKHVINSKYRTSITFFYPHSVCPNCKWKPVIIEMIMVFKRVVLSIFGNKVFIYIKIFISSLAILLNEFWLYLPHSQLFSDQSPFFNTQLCVLFNSQILQAQFCHTLLNVWPSTGTWSSYHNYTLTLTLPFPEANSWQ